MALERVMTTFEGMLAKLTHSETRLMHSRLRGHEFVRVWTTAVSGYNDAIDKNWLRRATGNLIGIFMDSRLPKKKQKNTKNAKKQTYNKRQQAPLEHRE